MKKAYGQHCPDRAPLALDSPYIQVYARGMQIVWDRTKARQNASKHGVRFADAVLVLDDPYAITVADNESVPTEARWVTLGADARAVCWWLFIRIAVKTFGSFPRDPLNPVNLRSMRHKDENLRLP